MVYFPRTNIEYLIRWSRSLCFRTRLTTYQLFDMITYHSVYKIRIIPTRMRHIIMNNILESKYSRWITHAFELVLRPWHSSGDYGFRNVSWTQLFNRPFTDWIVSISRKLQCFQTFKCVQSHSFQTRIITIEIVVHLSNYSLFTWMQWKYKTPEGHFIVPIPFSAGRYPLAYAIRHNHVVHKFVMCVCVY